MFRAGGVDTLYANLYGSWDEEKFEHVRKVFDEMQTEAREGRAGLYRDWQGGVLKFAETGARSGAGYCKWIFEWSGMRVLVADRAECHEKLVSVIVQIGSLVLMEMGHEQAWSSVCELLSRLGFKLSKAVPSRVDVCVDLPGVSVEEFASLFNEQRCICRAKTQEKYLEGWRTTGLCMGTDIKLRIYDKLLEVKKSGDGRKLEVLEATRWGGRVKCATRVEFQLRRDPLRELFSVDTMGQLFEKLPSICSYLTAEWCRFTESPVDRDNKHQGRAVVDPLWVQVQQLFAKWTGPISQMFQRRPRPVPCVARVLRMGLGCLTSAFAVLGVIPESVGEFLATIPELLNDLSHDAVRRISQKADEYLATVPASFFPPGLAELKYVDR